MNPLFLVDPETSTLEKITFYNKASILIFSILLSGVGGAILLGYNLRTVGKNKIVVPLILIMLFGSAIVRRIIIAILPGTIYELLIPNLICGLILVFPVWNNYLGEFPEYSSKHVWWPILAVVILYGVLIIGNWILYRNN